MASSSPCRMSSEPSPLLFKPRHLFPKSPLFLPSSDEIDAAPSKHPAPVLLHAQICGQVGRIGGGTCSIQRPRALDGVAAVRRSGGAPGIQRRTVRWGGWLRWPHAWNLWR
uniref:Uncharacterized protein n=1 Tax=Arundo donax TaxID=35708 RepID=A0A0A9CV27_ARUDO